MKKEIPRVWFLVILLFGCSSIEKREKERNQYLLHKISIENFQVRRPNGEGADPVANPGGPDYFGTPLPNSQLDCVSHASLFSGVSLPELKRCILSFNGPGASAKRVVYRLRRLSVPFLELEDPELAPACLRELLPQIPVPREIFFQNEEEGSLQCFSSRLDIEAEQVPGLGVNWPLIKTEVRIDLPPESVVDTDRKLLFLLLSWSLSPFFVEPDEVLLSHLVPDSICSKCIGEKKMYRPKGPPIPYWP